MKKQQRSAAPLLAAALGSWGCASEYPELFAELPPSMSIAAGEAPPEPAMAEPGTAPMPPELEMPAPIDELPSIGAKAA